MKVENEKFRRDLCESLSASAESLLDCGLALMKREISEGWRCFYPREICFMENLPPPLINELGRRYMCEEIKSNLYKKPGESVTEYDMTFLLDIWSDPVKRIGYRNFLEVGTLTLGATTIESPVLDVVADSVVNGMLESENRHLLHEIGYNRDKWYIEASLRGTLTPPPMYVVRDRKPPIRDENVPLAKDFRYWHSIYHNEYSIVYDVNDRHVQVKPDCCLQLMAALGPDFPYEARLSTASRLVFLQVGDSPVAWALIIEKADGAPDYRYPPRLVLCRRDLGKKLKEKDVLFENVIGKKRFLSIPDSPRAIEIELLFHLPRSRRLIEFYAPFVQAAIDKQL